MRKITFGQFIVLAFAVLATLAFVTGVHGFARGGGLLLYHGWERAIALVAAVFCFTWFFGLRSRRIWAWYIGCALFLSVIVQVFVVQGVLIFLEEPATFFGWWALISQTLFALVIFFILKKWWVPKKHEFRSHVEA